MGVWGSLQLVIEFRWPNFFGSPCHYIQRNGWRWVFKFLVSNKPAEAENFEGKFQPWLRILQDPEPKLAPGSKILLTSEFPLALPAASCPIWCAQFRWNWRRISWCSVLLTWLYRVPNLSRISIGTKSLNPPSWIVANCYAGSPRPKSTASDWSPSPVS